MQVHIKHEFEKHTYISHSVEGSNKPNTEFFWNKIRKEKKQMSRGLTTLTRSTETTAT